MSETQTSRSTGDDVVATNLAVVDQHLTLEVEQLDAIMELYTDDVVWEAPSRGQIYRSHKEIRDGYNDIDASMDIESITTLRRFATEQWVFDDSVWLFTLVQDRMPNLGFPVGSKLSMRKVSLFEMRGGKICREINYTMFRPADDPGLTNDEIPADAITEILH